MPPRRVRTRAVGREVPEGLGEVLVECAATFVQLLMLRDVWRVSAAAPSYRAALKKTTSDFCAAFFRATGRGSSSPLTFRGSAASVAVTRARLDAVAPSVVILERDAFLCFGGEDEECERLDCDSLTVVGVSTPTVEEAMLRTGAAYATPSTTCRRREEKIQSWSLAVSFLDFA